jgi:iron(III) transport system permease protein
LILRSELLRAEKLRCGAKAIIKAAAAFLTVFFTAAPLFCLAAGASAAALGGTLNVVSFAGPLFLRTVAVESGAALLSVLLGFFAALGIWTFFEKQAERLAVALLLLYIIPPFIHLQSWIFVMDRINELIAGFLPFSPNFTGSFAVILTTAVSGLPVTAGLALFSLISVPPELADLSLLDSNGARVFFRVYLPYLAPSLAIGGFFVFFLNVNDFAIPSVFGVNVFALEIFARFSAGMNIYEVFAVSLPLLSLCAASAALFGLYIKKSGFSLGSAHGKNPFKNEKFIRIPAVLGIVVVAAFVIVPLAALMREAAAAEDILPILKGSAKELAYSLETSALTAVLCVVPSMLFAYLFYRSKRRVLLLSLASLPFVTAAPVAGLALIKMWNTHLLGPVYRSPAMPAVAMLSRFAFIGMLMMTSAFMRLDGGYIDGLRLYYPGHLRAALCVFRLVKKECIASMLIIFALAMGEFGMTLLVTPPGYQTLANKIYNYLHYGASGTIAVLCLFMLIIVFAAVLLAYFILTGGKNGEKDY